MHATSSGCGPQIGEGGREGTGVMNKGRHSRHARSATVFGIMAVVSLLSLVAGRGDVPAAQASPTANGYALVQDVTTATFSRMVDFAMLPGTTDQAVIVSQQEARLRRVG